MTHRHDDALAALDPADRALVLLSVTRGLDDARIAQLTGVASAAVRARRERVLATVASQLGIQPDEVSAALRADADPHPLTQPPPPLPPPPPSAAPPVPPRPLAPTPPPSPASSPDRSGRRARRPWVIAVGVLALVALGLVILLTDGGTSTPRRTPRIHPARSPRTATPTHAAHTAHTTQTSHTTHSTHVPVKRSAALRRLPGGPKRASGRLTLRRRGTHLTLDVRVSFLPILHHGHYAAFLYDTILDSRPLGVVRPHGVTRLRLPADAARYRDIDVSDQPRGAVNPSGESRLRGPNPARAYARDVRDDRDARDARDDRGTRRGSPSSAPSTR